MPCDGGTVYEGGCHLDTGKKLLATYSYKGKTPRPESTSEHGKGTEMQFVDIRGLHIIGIRMCGTFGYTMDERLRASKGRRQENPSIVIKDACLLCAPKNTFCLADARQALKGSKRINTAQTNVSARCSEGQDNTCIRGDATADKKYTPHARPGVCGGSNLQLVVSNGQFTQH
ncbi:hypothetical protein FISHEDRAFT_61010 [Fistulina hepatica ATCC 64428]|uniref:Uncharacterized protein n=1 Tax=Fistulina hepatica ATCC 64428 TaxID=1128425 RepID=A0A0D7A4E6_9AGAR|nr:hypothetical protein FISHEDRAFT_61010 [Fistulina hepatica ATCC 64428]